MLSHFTLYADTFLEMEKAFKKAISSIDFKPTLAFAFVSVALPLTEMMRLFDEHNIDLFGVTSSGEILFTKEEDVLLDGGGVVVLTDMDRAFYNLSMIDNEEVGSEEFGKKIGKHILQAFPESSVLLGASGLHLDGKKMVEGILDVCGKGLTMFGGLAGDDAKFEQTYVFTQNKVNNNGAVVLVFDKKHVALNGFAYSGWVGLGAELTVTRSKGNVVYEIDHEPALTVYKNYLNVNEEDLPSIGIEYPLMIREENVTDGPLRAVLSVDKENKTLTFAGSVPQGSIISFSTSPGFEIMESTRQKIIDYYEKAPLADLLILFSCVARHLALGPLITSEIKLAAIKWNKPIIGFFSYGEIGNNMNNQCDFYNQTFTLATINIL